MDSILNTIKKLVGIPPEHPEFDMDIIVAINTALMVLNQIGIGPIKPFYIESDAETWKDFLGEDYERCFEAVKTYISIRVRLAFDPPQSSYVLNALKEQQDEYEWRLGVMAETPTWATSSIMQTP